MTCWKLVGALATAADSVRASYRTFRGRPIIEEKQGWHAIWVVEARHDGAASRRATKAVAKAFSRRVNHKPVSRLAQIADHVDLVLFRSDSSSCCLVSFDFTPVIETPVADQDEVKNEKRVELITGHPVIVSLCAQVNGQVLSKEKTYQADARLGITELLTLLD
jgi:hypothetical protein